MILFVLYIIGGIIYYNTYIQWRELEVDTKKTTYEQVCESIFWLPMLVTIILTIPIFIVKEFFK